MYVTLEKPSSSNYHPENFKYFSLNFEKKLGYFFIHPIRSKNKLK